eukprot:UN00945
MLNSLINMALDFTGAAFTALCVIPYYFFNGLANL